MSATRAWLPVTQRMAGNDVQDYRWTALRFGTSYSVNKEQSRKLSIDLNVFYETLMNDLCLQPCAPNSSLERIEETQRQAHDEDREASRKRGGIKGRTFWLKQQTSTFSVTGYVLHPALLGVECGPRQEVHYGWFVMGWRVLCVGALYVRNNRVLYMDSISVYEVF